MFVAVDAIPCNGVRQDRSANIPLPAVVECRDGGFLILGKIVGDKALI
jgi:hypothetical protein